MERSGKLGMEERTMWGSHIPTVGAGARPPPSSPGEGQSPRSHSRSENLPMATCKVGEEPKQTPPPVRPISRLSPLCPSSGPSGSVWAPTAPQWSPTACTDPLSRSHRSWERPRGELGPDQLQRGRLRPEAGSTSSRTHTSGLLGLPPTQLCSCVKHILAFLSITSLFGQKETSVQD